MENKIIILIRGGNFGRVYTIKIANVHKVYMLYIRSTKRKSEARESDKLRNERSLS